MTQDLFRTDAYLTECTATVTVGIARLVAGAHPVTMGTITDEELETNPAQGFGI